MTWRKRVGWLQMIKRNWLRIKQLDMEDVYDLYIVRDNYKHHWDKWKNLYKYRGIPYSWNRKEYCEDVSFSQNDSQCNLNQNPRRIFVEINKLILQFICQVKEPKTAKTILKKNKVGELILSSIIMKPVVQTVWHWPKYRWAGQWHRTECPETDPNTYGYLKTSYMLWGPYNLFNK